MKREYDQIKLECRDEVRSLIAALDAIPEAAKNEAVKELIAHLEYMDMMW